MTTFARDTYNNPEPRGSIVGAEVDDAKPIIVNVAKGTVTFYVRFVTQFNPNGSSAQYAVGGRMIEVAYDAFGPFLTKLMTEARAQGKLRNGTLTLVTAAPTFPTP